MFLQRKLGIVFMNLELLMKELLMILFVLIYFLIVISFKEKYLKYLKITSYFTFIILLTYITFKVISVIFQYIFEGV